MTLRKIFKNLHVIFEFITIKHMHKHLNQGLMRSWDITKHTCEGGKKIQNKRSHHLAHFLEVYFSSKTQSLAAAPLENSNMNL